MECRDGVVRLVKWPRENFPPNTGELRQRLQQQGLRILRMVDPPCTYYPERIRDVDEICWLVRGRIEVGFPDGEVFNLSSGDRMELPAGARHWLRVVSEEGAVYLLASR